jgi:hypothetical protein
MRDENYLSSMLLTIKKGMLREFARWPKYHAAYMRAFDRMLSARRQSGLDCQSWSNAQAVMSWWVHGREVEDKDFENISLDTLIHGGN